MPIKISPLKVTICCIRIILLLLLAKLWLVHDAIIVLERKADWAVYEGLGFCIFITILYYVVYIYEARPIIEQYLDLFMRSDVQRVRDLSNV